MAGIGKRARKPAHMRYLAENRRLAHKRQRVLKGSKGRWTYESLVAHGRKKEPEALKRKLRELEKELQELKRESFERNRVEYGEKEQERKALVGRLRRIACAA